MHPIKAASSSVVLLLGIWLLGACGDDLDPVSAPSPASEEAAEEAAEPLRVLLVNDDGVINPAIDVMVDALTREPGVEITVIAPAEERSGSSDTTTDGGVTYRETTTPGGTPAYAVDGYPADAVAVGLDDLGLDPHLVFSGINPGQNIGPFAALSGTVGVGRTAIGRGLPALAVSAGPEFVPEQFAVAAQLALDWIREHRDALVAGTAQVDTVTSINVPTCAAADMGEPQVVVRATEFPAGANPFASTCDLSGPVPTTDYEALSVGYPAVTQVPDDI